MLLPIIYGGIHLNAWAFDFPTSVERIIWKVCYIDIMATLVSFIAMVVVIGDFIRRLDRLIYWVSGKEDVLEVVLIENLALLLSKILYIVVFIYIISRVFIIVESFISLQHVPIRVYATPA